MPEELNPFKVFVRTFKETYAQEMTNATDAVPRIEEDHLEAKDLPTTALTTNFANAMSVLGSMFQEAGTRVFGGLTLDQIEVNLEVSADGKLTFLGSGAALKGSTSFRLLFERSNEDMAGLKP